MFTTKAIAIFDGNTRRRLCYLCNAYDISYSKTTSTLWTASFTLPYGDRKNAYCLSMNLVEIWDVDGAGKDKYIGLFRIMPSESSLSASKGSITYQLEHVLATLLDDTMLDWNEIGNLGVYTNSVISFILGKQSIRRWNLGACDYRHQYLYGWQDENLLSALFSVTNAFLEDDYRWEFDTKNFPWTLNLKKVSSDVVTDIRYHKNINGINKTVDPTNLTTRLYCYGYGESDNRLTISGVNGGIPYLESPNISKYGAITRVWTDGRFTQAESLLQTGRAMLKAFEDPIVSYDVDIATIRKAADLEAGDMVRIVDGKTDIYTRVVEVSKDDVSGQPLVGRVILANKNTDIAQSTADLVDRQRIATTYSQGAESIFADSLYDNADASNPAELTFTVPENAVHVNEILFSAKLTQFRAYSKATLGGGASTTTSSSGGATSTTSGSGGGSQQTSGSGGGSQQTSTNGGNASVTSNSGGSSSVTSNSGGNSQTTSDAIIIGLQNLQNTTTNDDNGTNHNHGINRGVPLLTGLTIEKNSAGAVTNVKSSNTNWTPSGAHTHGSHTHTVNVPSHTHTVNIPNHTHNVQLPSHQHSVSIPTHTHSVYVPSHEHSVYIPNHTHNTTLPNHTHDILYGIYKGGTASTMTVAIDGRTVGTYSYSVTGINLIAYMTKNANGDVMRGQHTIRITPNALTRVECAIQIRLFTNAHGGVQA